MQEQDGGIYILSGPIQTGKTTQLIQWMMNNWNFGGILTPDIHGKRMLLDIGAGKLKPLQLNDDEVGINIGRFVFDSKTFEFAGKILQESFHQEYDWIIVDEIGRLELDKNKGLEPYLSDFLKQFKQQQSKTKLLLVVRDYLLQEVIGHYDLASAMVINEDFFEQKKAPVPLTGLVLCGGQSVRMGRDKAFIQYHPKMQYAYTADMMSLFCKQVYISCNDSQLAKISKPYFTVRDSATFENAGPMNGLLSAFDQYNHTGFLVMGCDYPAFNLNDMKALMMAREPGIDVVCFHNSETKFDEPLLAIYEKQCAPLLQEFYQNGNTSLSSFLKTVKIKRITPMNFQSIKSVDSANQ